MTTPIPPGTPVDLAGTFVDRFEVESQSGEWKFHQAYAALLKTKEGQALIVNDEKWKAGLAINVAIAQRRMA